MTRRTFYQPNGRLTWDLVNDLLCMVGADPSPDEVQQWTFIELLTAYDWAIREHLIASDNAGIKRRPKPWFIENVRTNQ